MAAGQLWQPGGYLATAAAALGACADGIGPAAGSCGNGGVAW